MSAEEDAKSEESMDSFVRDAPQPRGPLQDLNSPASPTSSSFDKPESTPRAEAAEIQQQTPATEPGDLTFATPSFQQQQRRPSLTPSLHSDVGTITSQTGSIPPTPAHNFFQTLGYEQDSDASAASLVFKPTSSHDSLHKTGSGRLTPQLNGDGSNRNRLHSYDSVGSSNSLRLISPRSRRQSQPLTPTSIKPHLLPYSERRKLLQQRQKQQQQAPNARQPQSFNQAYPPQGMPFPHQLHHLPLVMPDAVTTNQQLPPYPVMSYPMQPSGMQPYPAAPQGYPPPPQAQQLPGYPTAPSPQTRQSYRDLMQTVGLTARPGPAPQRRLVPRPPVRASSAPTADRPHTEPHESLVEAPYPVPLVTDAIAPPPPPLAYAQSPPILVRQGSTGSVSSLGSMDRSGRESPITAQQLAHGFVDGMGHEHSGDALNLQALDLHHAYPEERDITILDPQPISILQASGDVYQERHESFPTIVHENAQQTLMHVLEHGSYQQQQTSRSRGESSRIGARAPSGTPQRYPVRSRLSEREGRGRRRRRGGRQTGMDQGDDGSTSHVSSSGASESDSDRQHDVRALAPEPHERTRLLPPPGASTSEIVDKAYTEEHRRLQRDPRRLVRSAGRPPSLVDSGRDARETEHRSRRKQNRKGRKKKHQSHNLRRGNDASDSSLTSNDSGSKDHWMGRRQRMLDIERARLIKQWKAEARAEANANSQDNCCFPLCQAIADAPDFSTQCSNFLSWLEPLVANLPITIGAIGLAIANLGVDWFKFAEENDPHCMSVHFHSASQCSFPEFPGCYYCETHTQLYKVAAIFRLSCSILGGILGMMYMAKLACFHRIVFDELSSPTSAAPAGLVCVCLAVSFTGRGMLGMIVVSVASGLHLCLAVWFIYMALAYRILPEPSWFPNTVAIGISALKTWLYFPTAGHFLAAISMSLNFFLFPASVVRVALNRKIKAHVAWMQMSAPNVALYTMTIMAQPSFQEEHPDITSYQKIHRAVYLPCMHFLFGLVVVGMLASVTSLLVRWRQFQKTPFSPAHAAFCNPCLYHASSIQAYRAAVISFAGLPVHHPYLTFLYVYWVVALVGGTLITLAIATRFLWCLGSWTHFDDMPGDAEPPAPYETTMTLSNMIHIGDTLVQSFVSPAILQANETGQLIFSRDLAGTQVYRRTREIAALGFEPIMTQTEMEVERELLADFVGKNPPRRRHRSLSVPGIDFNYGAYIHAGTSMFDLESSTPQRERES